MVDRFRYSYTFPAESTELPIVFERELRPGRYKLRLKVEDDNSTKAAVREIDFDVEVPDIDKELAADAAADAELEKAATAALAVLALQGPEGEGISGIQRFTAMVGANVAKVEFYLDGKLILAKNRPPFEVELDIGPVPRLATVTAVALDSAAVELDRKQFSLNVGRERFLVRLQPVSAADRSGDKVHTVATVNVPPDRKLEKLELYWNEMLTATVYAAPFEAWLPVQDSGEIGYLRALAVLDDGAQAEDVQFVNAPQFLAGVKVEAVELPITVLDKEGKPVEGLVQDDFEVFEDGVAQAVSHFSMQRELPIRVGLVIDTSGSMEKTLPEVQRVVLGFLKNLLRPRDRASILAFSERPALIEGFTADFGALERALIALRPERETAFYDAVVHGLFQFSGVRGRKAMIVLTDGEDNASKMTFDKALDYAQRSGVTIYAIGIDLPITKVKARSQLSRLARMTGGEAFFLARESALAPVYEQINRELRSQYLIAFTSTAETNAEQFRKITVKLRKPELDVRTIAGYYPGG
jgi:VWFA-related protein